MSISMAELRNKIKSLDDETIVLCYRKLCNCMIVNPQLCKSGDLFVFNTLRSEIKNRPIIIDSKMI